MVLKRLRRREKARSSAPKTAALRTRAAMNDGVEAVWACCCKSLDLYDDKEEI